MFKPQDVVNAVYNSLCNDPRVGQLVREQECPIITQDDIECSGVEFDLLNSGPICGVRVRLDIPVVEFRCGVKTRQWSYDEFLASDNKFTESLYAYLDSYEWYVSPFQKEVEAARINPEIVKCKRVWYAYLKRACDWKSREILKKALQRICDDPVHSDERRPFHHNILADWK